MFKRTIGREMLWRSATLAAHKIFRLPIVFLEPHSACNCRCVMCDIWKSNSQLQQMSVEGVEKLLSSLRQLGTRQIVLTGGEPLLHPRLFDLCQILKREKIWITLLSTGLLLQRKAKEIVENCDEIIVSLDGPEVVHDRIRRIPQAYARLQQGVETVQALRPEIPILGRCVIQQENFRSWPAIIKAARKLGLSGISFLPADLFSEAFNRTPPWSGSQRRQIGVSEEELPVLKRIVQGLRRDFRSDFESGFIRESPDKIEEIYDYFAAALGKADFSPAPCNAPWVSAVLEPSGQVRPCFFLPAYPVQDPNRELKDVLNTPANLQVREDLNTQTHPVCRHCVCRIRLPPTVDLGK